MEKFKMPRKSRKREAIEDVFNYVIECGSRDLIFDNELVKKITSEKFSNQFDTTKFDNSSKLPDLLREKDYFIIHLGEGRHQFIKGINKGYHEFEKIPEDKIIDWRYKKSVLNDLYTSETSISSLINNQRILHDFLYEDIVAHPKVYNPGSTKISFEFFIDNKKMSVIKLQRKIDMILEYLNNVDIIEAKNGEVDDFAIYQLYHIFRWFCGKKTSEKLNIKKIEMIFVNKIIEEDLTKVRLRSYIFERVEVLNSIKLVKCAQYNLLKR